MSIAWATVVLVVLLSPGFACLWGFYVPNQVTREAAPASPLGQLAGVVVFGFFIHALAYCLINSRLVCQSTVALVPCVDFDELAVLLRIDGVTPAGVQPRRLGPMFDAYAPWILSYFILLTLCSAALGFAMGKAVESGRVTLFARHRYLFMLEAGRRLNHQEGAAQQGAQLVRAHVLSRTAYEQHVLLYDGVLRDFFAKADGTISYIVLSGAHSAAVDITAHGSVRSPTPRPLGRSSPSAQSVPLLVLSHDDIANVYFEHLNTVTNSAVEEAQLDEAVRLFELDAAAGAQTPPGAGGAAPHTPNAASA